MSLSAATDIIFNNKFEPFSKQLFEKIDNGNITLVDNNNDNKYDVAFINTYVNGVVDNKSLDGKTLRFKNNISSIILDKYTDYEIVDISGDEIAFEQIAENSILSIFESKDKSYIQIVVGTGSYIGRLNEIYKDGNTTSLNIDGTLVKVDNAFANTGFLKPGISGEFLKDAYGNITYFIQIPTKDSGYAYLVNIVNKNTDGTSEEVYIKMYTEDKQLLNIKTAKKVILDGISGQPCMTLMSYKPLFTWNEYGVKENVKPQLIAYRLNSEGNLLAIDTAEVYNEDIENPDSSLFPIVSGNLEYNSLNGSMGRELYLNNNCKVFTVPSDNSSSADYEEFGIELATALFKNDMKYEVLSYKTSMDTYGADIIITDIKAGNGFDNSDHVYVISNITDVWDEKEEASVKKITYYHDGEKLSCVAKDTSLLTGISIGDIVVLSINTENELAMAPKLLYDLDADTDNDNNTTQIPEIGRGNYHRVYYGTVYGLKGNLMTITKDPEAQNVSTELHRVPDYIYTIEADTGFVRLGENADIVDYLSDKENCSKVVFYETRGYDYDLVIIK